MSFVWPAMLHIKKIIGMHNKRTYTSVFTYAYTRIDIHVYAKYERIMRVCVVRIYLSCTVIPPYSPNIPAPILFISMLTLWALNHRPFVFLWIHVLIPYQWAMETWIQVPQCFWKYIIIHCSSNTFPSLNYTNYYTAVHVPQTIYKLILL